MYTYKYQAASPKWEYSYNSMGALDSEEGDEMPSILSPVAEGNKRWMSNPMNPLFDGDKVRTPWPALRLVLLVHMTTPCNTVSVPQILCHSGSQCMGHHVSRVVPARTV